MLKETFIEELKTILESMPLFNNNNNNNNNNINNDEEDNDNTNNEINKKMICFASATG